MKWPSREELNKQDMSSILNRVPNDDTFKEYINWDAGKDHYRLLVWISKQFSNSIFSEVGVYKGFSGCALSNNLSNKVYGFEIVDCINSDLPENYTLIFGNVLQNERIIKKSSLILYDTVHDGNHEIEFINWLKSINYKGVVIFDDIFLNEQMKSFWNSIELRKQDITEIGHWSGTGVVWM
jgi:hypothetical protein